MNKRSTQKKFKSLKKDLDQDKIMTEHMESLGVNKPSVWNLLPFQICKFTWSSLLAAPKMPSLIYEVYQERKAEQEALRRQEKEEEEEAERREQEKKDKKEKQRLRKQLQVRLNSISSVLSFEAECCCPRLCIRANFVKYISHWSSKSPMQFNTRF